MTEADADDKLRFRPVRGIIVVEKCRASVNQERLASEHIKSGRR